MSSSEDKTTQSVPLYVHIGQLSPKEIDQLCYGHGSQPQIEGAIRTALSFLYKLHDAMACFHAEINVPSINRRTT